MDTLAMTSALVHLMKGDVAGVCVCFVFVGRCWSLCVWIGGRDRIGTSTGGRDGTRKWRCVGCAESIVCCWCVFFFLTAGVEFFFCGT